MNKHHWDPTMPNYLFSRLLPLDLIPSTPRPPFILALIAANPPISPLNFSPPPFPLPHPPIPRLPIHIPQPLQSPPPSAPRTARAPPQPNSSVYGAKPGPHVPSPGPPPTPLASARGSLCANLSTPCMRYKRRHCRKESPRGRR